jgi:uncharacterized protein (DUF1697 family)
VALYVALLRGINVGGKNLIKMPALRECFELGGFEDVTTYIQSGNVLFRATGSASALATRIEKMLTKTFDYQATVVVRNRTQMRSTVEKAPRGFGAEPNRYLCDVAFLKEPLTASTALKQVPLREEVDEAWAGRGVLYLRRLSSRATQSRINRIATLSIYKDMTLRSWSTTTRLLTMMDGSFN